MKFRSVEIVDLGWECDESRRWETAGHCRKRFFIVSPGEKLRNGLSDNSYAPVSSQKWNI